MSRLLKRLRVVLVATLVIVAPPASAFGPDGHLIAGLAAEPYLCGESRAEIAVLSNNEEFEALGRWADRVRGDDRWRHTAPWHYMNIADGARLSNYRHPREGDVLWAIENFSIVLADQSESHQARSQALKFLTHFIVDIHQPLHVGRASDRGGNSINVRFGRESVNLHRFWDTDVIKLAGLRPAEHVQRMASLVSELHETADLDPNVWAQESLALRPDVYDFDRRTGQLDVDYLQRSQSITERRLALAAVRLAGTLNRIFCS